MKETRWWIWLAMLVAVLGWVALFRELAKDKAPDSQKKQDVMELANEVLARSRANVEAAEKEEMKARLAKAEAKAELAMIVAKQHQVYADHEEKLATARKEWNRLRSKAKTPEARAEIDAIIAQGEKELDEAFQRLKEAGKKAQEVLESTP